MGAGAFVEPLVVVVLLFGGTWVNRNRRYQLFGRRHARLIEKRDSLSTNRDGSPDSLEAALPSDSLLNDPYTSSSSPQSPTLLQVDHEPRWRTRRFGVMGISKEVTSPNTRVFKDYFLSRLLLKFPFLVEAWYWALIYWVYQLGRAFTAVNLVESTVDVARAHALQLVHIEQRLRIFWEPAIQAAFLEHPTLMHWINRIYSFIHIPGTIFFLVWLYYYTTTRNRIDERQPNKEIGEADGSPAGPRLYEARRRTMAVCNLLAFIVFTAWPCMPPRLLSDKSVKGSIGDEARSYGFVDTVHGKDGESSVWTQNKFCNQYAAMPSLHFGYALMIGLTVATIPLAPHHRHSRTTLLPFNLRLRLPSAQRLLCVALGFAYAFTILVAIVTTANHFILDAVAGACVCGLGWTGNSILLNLLPLEDYFLWCVRIHKPERWVVNTTKLDENESTGVVEESVRWLRR